MRLALKPFLLMAVLLLLAAGVYFAFATDKQKTKSTGEAAQTIKSGVAQAKSVPIVVRANGNVTAFNMVEVRPQIQNVVRQVHVREGQEVRAGQLLFSLDPRGDQSSLSQSRAELTRARAELTDAESTLQRNRELLAKKFVSQAVVDAAASRVAALRGTLEAGNAAVQSSSVSLGYNQIRASIGGRIGAINVYPGTLVQPAGAALLTIAQLDPIAVSFTVPERELSHIVASYPRGEAPVVAQLASGQEVTGKLVFIDNASDQQSGTLRMKAQFDNRERQMWPGAFVNVRLVTRTIADAVVVPAQAVVNGPIEASVYVVQDDSTVRSQTIQVQAMQDGEAVVTGIAAGTRLVIEGTQNLKPGAKVKEVQAQARAQVPAADGMPQSPVTPAPQ